jgi:uncharacterized protein with ParB-like and HNH nuclease domain
MTDFFAKIDQQSIHNLIQPKFPMYSPITDYNCFAIPAFQRKYSWDKSQWEKFWDDAEEHINTNEAWFLGSIITLNTNKQQKAVHHDIIDGQQRLTTIFIFRIAVFYVLNQLIKNVSSIPKELDFAYWKDYLVNVCDIDRLVHTNDYVAVAPQQTRLIQLYDKYVKDSDTTTVDKRTKYYQAFEFFRKKLENLIAHADLGTQYNRLVEYVSIVNNAQVIWAQVKDLPNAMAMFEVLNNRGKPLNSTDIIKTSFLKHSIRIHKLNDSSPDEQHSVYTQHIQNTENYWNNIFKQLLVSNSDEVAFKRFLRHFYIVYNPTLDKKQLYRSVTEKQVMQDYDRLFSTYHSDTEFEKLRTTLSRYAVYYGILREPLTNSDKIIGLDGLGYLKKFINNRHTTRPENYIVHMLSDINKLGLVQINLLNLYIFSVFMDNITNDNEYNARVNMLHVLISSVFRFVIRRNLTDVPRPNQTDTKLTELMNDVEDKHKNGILHKLLIKPIDKLKEVNNIVNTYTALSSETIATSIQELRYYHGSSNLDVRFMLHFLEKWKMTEDVNVIYVLRDSANPFDGFKRRGSSVTSGYEYEIEHIMPQSLLAYDSQDDDEESEPMPNNDSNNQDWQRDLTTWSSTFFNRSVDEQAEIVHSLGNLTMLSHNPEASNHPFAKKQNLEGKYNTPIGYNASTPHFLNEIPVSNVGDVTLRNVSKWTEVEITERTRQMQRILAALLGDL